MSTFNNVLLSLALKAPRQPAMMYPSDSTTHPEPPGDSPDANYPKKSRPHPKDDSTLYDGTPTANDVDKVYKPITRTHQPHDYNEVSYSLNE